jgi:hypothetical protein
MVKWGDESIEATRNYQEINHVKQGSFVRDTIESLAKIGQLKQEIEYLKGINERMIWHVKRVDELSRENEKLRAQVGMMKKTLIKASCYLIDLPDDSLSKEIEELILDNIIQDYHNPADVEVLKQARGALCDALDEATYSREWHVKEAIAEVDKAIGGKTDV